MDLLTTEFLANSLISRNITYVDFMVQISRNVVDISLTSFLKLKELDNDDEFIKNLVDDFINDETVFNSKHYEELLDSYINFDITRFNFVDEVLEQTELEESRLLGAFIETDLLYECKRLALALESINPYGKGDLLKVMSEDDLMEDNKKSMDKILNIIYSKSFDIDALDDNTKIVTTIVVEYLVSKAGSID